MKEINKDNNDVADRLMSYMPLEETSELFTEQVLVRMRSEKVSDVYKYKPLINFKVLFLSILSIIVFTAIVLIEKPMSKTSWFDNLNLSNINLDQINYEFPHFTTSHLAVYGSVFLLVMLLIQISAINNLHTKSLKF